ncbi:MAG TPA: hypothetical protein VHO49_07640 [Anaerolineales bacterium]|nr:hypothetical protein [Anaerolineales bacterium]
MAYYLVQAQPVEELLTELRQRLDSGEIRVMRPFGQALQYSLENARVKEGGLAVWEEEDYCVPPLAQERAAILDTYFRDLNVDRVEKGKGWEQIESLPNLW